MRKICIITGTRAEYGLLYWLLKEIQEDSELSLQLIVSGMHLSPRFGLTYKAIEEDGFKIDYKVPMFLEKDEALAITQATGNAIGEFAKAYAKLKPDIVLY